MDDSNKDLLHWESNNASATTIESRLLVCGTNNLRQQLNPKPKPSGGVPLPTAPKSQVLEKVKDFLGVISEANKRLDDDAKDNAKDYNIEVLTGNESEYIEMDLMLGVADLHTPEAVAAAESAIAGSHADMLLASGQTESESEDSDDDDDDEGDDESDDDDNQNANRKRFELSENEFREASKNCKSKKRPKIVELP